MLSEHGSAFVSRIIRCSNLFFTPSVCHHGETLELRTCQQQLCFCSRFGARVMMLPCFDTNKISIKAAKTISEWLLKLWCHHFWKSSNKKSINKFCCNFEMSRISRCISSALTISHHGIELVKPWKRDLYF